MKKIFSILIFSLFLTVSAYAEKATLKCVIKEKEVYGEKQNTSDEEALFFDFDTNDKKALKNDITYNWIDIFESEIKGNTDKLLNFTSINRYDLKRVEKTISINQETANDFEKVLKNNKNVEKL